MAARSDVSRSDMPVRTAEKAYALAMANLAHALRALSADDPRPSLVQVVLAQQEALIKLRQLSAARYAAVSRRLAALERKLADR